MARVARASFQVFAKPVGAACNLACSYCYYRDRDASRASASPRRMADATLEAYVARHVEACPDEVVRFSWHGGEPTLAGIDFFRRAVELQRRFAPGRRVANGLQTNGTLLDDAWADFLAEAGFEVGLSLDGPREVHDRFRAGRDGSGSYDRAVRGFEALRRRGVAAEVLCVVGAANADRPLDLYRFFRSLGAASLTFLPLVVPGGDRPASAGPASVAPDAWGAFLCAVFDEWTARGVGRVRVQIFEETARPAFGEEPALCLFRRECGGVPVVESDGSVYPCDHFASPGRRLGSILESPLADLLESPAQRAFGRAKADLPRACRECDVLESCRGECPKNRLAAPEGAGPRPNYLCAGYKRFFRHARPWVEAIAAERRRRDRGAPRPAIPGGRRPR